MIQVDGDDVVEQEGHHQNQDALRAAQNQRSETGLTFRRIPWRVAGLARRAAHAAAYWNSFIAFCRVLKDGPQ